MEISDTMMLPFDVSVNNPIDTRLKKVYIYNPHSAVIL
jgi:hypothetical protein